MYNYLYYKLYKLADSGAFIFWSEWKAFLLINILIFFIFFALSNYYSVFIVKYNIKNNIDIIIYITYGLICLFNFIIFHLHDNWKTIIKDFDKLPKKKNIIGGVIVYTFIILVFANLVFSFYLMSQIDWSLYK